MAVANAVDAIHAHADVTLALPDGQGVAEPAPGTAARRAHPPPSAPLADHLGIDDRGEAVTLPASQLNVAVCGGTGTGKSYLAGLMCEQLIGLGYAAVVFDPEGDHVGLGELRGVLVTGGEDRRLADPAEVVRLLRRRCTVVVDLSHLDADGKPTTGRPTAELEAPRALTGLPQWVVVDEAQRPVGRPGPRSACSTPRTKGYLLVTWRPEELSGEAQPPSTP